MKRFIILLLLSFSFTVQICAQIDLKALKSSSDAQARERKNESTSLQSERDSKWDGFMDSRKEEWAKTISNRDVEWVGFLNDTEWTLFDGFLYNERPKEPKPSVMPIAVPVLEPKPEPIVIPDQAVVLPVVTPSIEPKQEPIPCKPEEPDAHLNMIELSFFGRKFQIPFDSESVSFVREKYGQKEISAFWESLSETNYTSTVTKLLEIKDEIGLNDWGYYLLIDSFSVEMKGLHNAILMDWFLLVRSGFDAKVGYNNNGVSLLLPTETKLYGINYLKIEDRLYYVVKGDDKGIYSYRGQYSQGDQFGFEQKNQLNLGEMSQKRELSFEFQGTEYNMHFNYNPNIVQYYQKLPQAQFEVYFDAPVSQQLEKSVNTCLKPIVETMDKTTAMNFLLRFVQMAFPYQTDIEQFGVEKYFYADELFLFPYCDCEDRAVFYAYLVHSLLCVDVVGTEFPGHMATAVTIDNSVDGTSYIINGERYIIADPTYMNATVGQCMKQYETTKPTIHNINFAK